MAIVLMMSACEAKAEVAFQAREVCFSPWQTFGKQN
jgi:hypothetical protein